MILVVAASGLAAGCGNAPETTAEGPTVVCGTTWGQSAFYGAFKETKWVRVVHDLGGGPVSFTVARGCAHGSVVRWAPRSAARVVQIARARDGLMVALTLKPTATRSSFRLTVRREGKVTARVTVKITP
jgi:hypothetical protein